ncbi:hypothetical protein [Synechocystis sp. PCC 7509]|uniref:hypothetical protein n=1 Tax=Synechocystis sp. PCC 7509 TaxID=927677 RepID=UPI0011DCAFED|nr:hypothetical protein [Synechocystis sp. PCC 7509]
MPLVKNPGNSLLILRRLTDELPVASSRSLLNLIGELKIVCTLVKDVIFGEDAAPFSNYNAATNWSIIRNIARRSGYDSLTKAERCLAHDIDKLFSLLE